MGEGCQGRGVLLPEMALIDYYERVGRNWLMAGDGLDKLLVEKVEHSLAPKLKETFEVVLLINFFIKRHQIRLQYCCTIFLRNDADEVV